jgi:outer membrane protein OmpA-like peptidoglycan-associated protein
MEKQGMKGKRLFNAWVGMCCIFCATAGATINTGGQTGVVRTLSAKTAGALKMNIGTGTGIARSNDYVPVESIEPDDQTIGKFILNPSTLLSGDFYLSLGLLNCWDVGAALPFYYDWAGFGDLRDGGLGDIEVSTKVMLPPVSFDKSFYQAVYIGVTIPTGMTGNGLFPRHPYIDVDKGINPAHFYSTDYITVRPMMLFTFDMSKAAPVQVHINLGGVFTEVNKQNTMVGALAVEYTPTEFISLFGEVWGESRWSNFSSGDGIRRDPLYATPGIRISAPNGLYINLAADFSLSSKLSGDRSNWNSHAWRYSTNMIPDYGGQISIGWTGFLSTATQDADKDGIKNDVDRCPHEPEDIDGFEDSDGCPDPDNDKDGLCDPWVAAQGKLGKYAKACKGTDQCPNQPEDIDGFQDDDGCPDYDNDKDGVPDSLDQCPNAPEDKDGFADADGCPDFDNDHDGVPDTIDKCPNEPEDIDGFEDADGCPDPDNDKDGIPDLVDKCPNNPETFNGYKDEDGCPDTVPKPKKEPDFPKQQIMRGIMFNNNTAEITFDSFQWLDPIVKSLKEFPEIEIEIRGYTDALGNFAKNMQISQMRAEAVRQYFINQGIESQRVRAAGFGPGSPIADNRSAAGRAQNRRIEIVRTK